MKRPIHIVFGLLLLVTTQNLSAQLVNDGAKISINQDALLYVGGQVTHKSGELLNNGEMVVAGNWVNHSANSLVFAPTSLGTVKFIANTADFSGIGTTVFPKLVFNGPGIFTMHTNIGAFISLDLGDAELQANNSQLTLLSTDPTSVQFNKGFISTGSSGLFVRHLKENADYIYPLGSSKLDLKRFVVMRPKQAAPQTIGVAFVDKDANLDGYSRSQKANSINDINTDFYHVLKRLDGTAAVDASFYTTATEKFNSLVNWTSKSSWDKALPITFQDNATVVNGLTKSFLHQSVSLPLGMDLPFAFADVNNTSVIGLYNAFSPDGDGKNDTWEVKNIDAFPDNDLKIYDRSGNMVFRANGYNSSKFWDGQNVSSGTYIYILRVKIDGKDEYFKGAITMVKN